MAKKDEDKKSGGFGGYTSVRDMFDGGGAGRSGDRFEGGGAISAIGNAARVAPRGYHDRNSGGGSSDAPQRTVSDRGILDFFDGGGLGARGSSFQGLPISTIFNTLGMRPQGSQVANPQQEVGLRDFYDGGGYGQSGQSFQGFGGYSMLANALGVKPAGYEERMAAAQAQPAPMAAPTMQYDPMYTEENYLDASGVDQSFRPRPVTTPEVTSSELAPVGAMPTEDLLALAERGIVNADFVNSRTNTQMYDDPLGREVNPLYVNYPFMRY